MIIFDMDGTILRLGVDIEEARQRLGALFAPYGITRPFRPILRRIREAAAEAAARGGDEAALLAQGLALLDEQELIAARDARPTTGAVETLAGLHARGVRLGLVTDNGRACVPVALAAAGIDPAWFTAIRTRDDVPAPKPDPAGLLAVLAAGDATDAWYVGDHPRDLEAGRAARATYPGLRLAGVKTGLASEPQLLAAGADRVLDRLEQVTGL